ncbi:MAG: hypothetical protein KA954_13380 [Chitinophagales bacterium]|nr:transcriptional regulator [Bacteroidota bacterium]MBP7400577.1 hypothetical protein [Chitinophagales bacterium]MBK8488894.1 transcriptional regulator [Bacteroidota bacterium]MBK8680744.1 transcriptional regulator [Bacteroidota bacterium]MBP8755019.1 hypothetical protein [Chitinophagales bacterium]
MELKPIITEKNYTVAMLRIEELWGSKFGTPEGDELNELVTLIEKYEELNFPIRIM